MQMTGETVVRWATLYDVDFVGQDRFIPTDVVRRKIEWQEVVVAERAGRRVGYLRLEYLWSMVPFIALITVLPAHRRRGVGRAMLGYVEAHLTDQGHDALYSSSQVDEPEPQAWHRHVGFEECGIITGVNAGGVSEVFFRKPLR
jgi:N-acetylglutamate synthase-like GNAT family acetyltransferase